MMLFVVRRVACLLVLIILVGFQSAAQSPARISLNTALELSPRAILNRSGVSEVLWSPGGQRFAVTAGTEVLIYDTADFTAAPLALSHGGEVWDMAFGPDGLTLATASTDSQIRLWTLPSGQLRDSLDAAAFDIAYSPDGSLLAYLRWGANVLSGEIFLWNLLDDSITPLEGVTSSGIVFSPGGDLLLAHLGGRNVARWQVRTLERLSDLEGLPFTESPEAGGGTGDPRDAIVYSPDSNRVAAVNVEVPRRLTIWNTRTNDLPLMLDVVQKDLNYGSATFFTVAFSRDSLIVAVAGGDYEDRAGAQENGVWLWAASSGSELGFLPHPGARSVAFSPDGTLIASAGGDEVRLWGLPDNSLTELQGMSQTSVIAYCDTLGTPPAVTPTRTVSVVWSWYATTRDLVYDHLNNVRYDVRLNRLILTDNWIFLSDIAPDPVNDNQPTVYFYAPLGTLVPIAYTVQYEANWASPISDGLTEYGPETDHLSDTGTCTFNSRG